MAQKSDELEDNVVPLGRPILRPDDVHKPKVTIDRTARELLNTFQQGIDDPNQRVSAFMKLQGAWNLFSGDVRGIIRKAATETLDISEPRFEYCLTAKPEDVDDALTFRAISQDFKPGELIYPRDGFIGRYLDYAQYSQAHIGYHFWAGLATMGAACRRNFYVDADYLTPNIYVLLEGASGTFKTAALKCARRVFRQMIQTMSEMGELTRLQAPYIFPSQMTQRTLLNELANAGRRLSPGVRIVGNHDPGDLEHCGMVYVGEMTDLFSKEQFQADKITETFTSLYDGDFDEGTDKHGRNRFENVALAMLMCSTMSWLRDSMSEKTFNGGFLGGRVLAFSKGKSGRQYPRPLVLDPAARKELVRELIVMATTDRTRMRWRGNADAYYDDIYPTLAKGAIDERLESYYNRRQVHLRKLAMLMAINRGHQPWIELDDVETAWRLLQAEEPSMIRCFTAILQSEGKLITDAIVAYIRLSGGHMPLRKLNKQLAQRWPEKKPLIDSIKNQLYQGEIIRYREVRTKSISRKVNPPMRIVYLTHMEDSEGNAIHNIEEDGWES